MFPGLLVSVLLNLIAGGFFFFPSATSREDAQPYQFIQPAHQDYTEQDPYPEEENHFGDKMDQLEEIRGEYLNGAKHEYQSEKQMFDNMYMEDIYYNLPRAAYWQTIC